MTLGLLPLLTVPLGVVIVALLVFAADLVAPQGAAGADSQRGLGALTCMGLVAVLIASFYQPVGGIGGGAVFVVDGFTAYLQRIVLGAGALAALGGIDHVDRTMRGRQGEYYLLMLLSLVGMTLLAGARELVLLIVAFELMGIPLYALAAMAKGDAGSTEGSLKLYLTGAVSAAITLYGLSFLYGAAGTTKLPQIAAAIDVGRADPALLAIGAMLAIAGMGFKVGAVPFHMWVPDTYQGAPTPFVAFLSVAPKAAGFAALVRLFVEGLGAIRPTWWPMLMTVAVVTMVLGNVFALHQDNVKRLLAYSGIAHIGIMLLGFGIATRLGLGILLFYLAAYVFTNMGAFFVASVIGAEGSDELRGWAGLMRRSPALGAAMLLFLLSLGGIPFVAGFWAKLLLFLAVWQAGLGVLVLLGAVLAVVALFYYLRVARSMF
ncbi:MAG: NADH-quinone oxidoreductase subunit N, partial [Deltaproteobacteria bacterium]